MAGVVTTLPTKPKVYRSRSYMHGPIWQVAYPIYVTRNGIMSIKIVGYPNWQRAVQAALNFWKEPFP